jgi:ribosomal protein S18 acetylase RimI-like enzyme
MNETPIPFQLRSIELKDLEKVKRLSDEAGWNQTEKDWQFLIDNTDNICVLAETDSKIVGSSIAVNYNNQVAWFCMVLVDKNYRKQGISKAMLNYLFEHITCVDTKLDATSEGEKVYTHFGFKKDFKISRLIHPSIVNFTLLEDNELVITNSDQDIIRKLIEHDSTGFGVERKKLIEWLIKEYPYKAWVAKKDDVIAGYTLGREGTHYHHIGPMMANDIHVAESLLINALKELQGKPVVMDVVSDKTELINWLLTLGFEKQREFTRMYRNENIFGSDTSNLYLIAGPELG